MTGQIVEKNRICLEDLELGSGPVTQTRNGKQVDLTKINLTGEGSAFDSVLSFANVDDLIALTGVDGQSLALEASALLATTDLKASTIVHTSGTKGGAEYILTTLARLRTNLGDPAWEPSGADYYLIGGTTYVAYFAEDKIKASQCGAVDSTTLNQQATMQKWADFATKRNISKLYDVKATWTGRVNITQWLDGTEDSTVYLDPAANGITETDSMFVVKNKLEPVDVNPLMVTGLTKKSAKVTGFPTVATNDFFVIDTNEVLIRRIVEGDPFAYYPKEELCVFADEKQTLSVPVSHDHDRAQITSIKLYKREPLVRVRGIKFDTVDGTRREAVIDGLIKYEHRAVWEEAVEIKNIANNYTQLFLNNTPWSHAVGSQLEGDDDNDRGYGYNCLRTGPAMFLNINCGRFRHGLTGRHNKSTTVEGGSWHSDIDSHWVDGFVVKSATIHGAVTYCGSDIRINRNTVYATENTPFQERLDTPETTGVVDTSDNEIYFMKAGAAASIQTYGASQAFDFERTLAKPDEIICENIRVHTVGEYNATGAIKAVRHITPEGYDYTMPQKVRIGNITQINSNKLIEALAFWTKSDNIKSTHDVEVHINNMARATTRVPYTGTTYGDWGYEFHVNNVNDFRGKIDPPALADSFISNSKIYNLENEDTATDFTAQTYGRWYIDNNCLLSYEPKVINPPVFESFDNVTDWVLPSRGSIELTSTKNVQGDAAWYYSNKTNDIGTDIVEKTGYDQISTEQLGTISMYVRHQLPYANKTYRLIFGQDGNLPNLSVADAGFEVDLQYNPKAGYWHTFHYSEKDWLSALEYIDSTKIIVSNSTSSAPNIVPTIIDSIYTKAGGMPTLVIGFDDLYDSQHDFALPYMSALGLRGTVYTPTQNVSNWDDLRDMRDAGWGISIDGTPDDTSLILQSDATTAAALCVSQWADLAAEGLDSEAMYHMCYPNGEYHNAAIRPIDAGDLTSDGTTTVTFTIPVTITAGAKLVYGPVFDEDVDIRVVTGGTNVTSVVVDTAIPADTAPAVFYNDHEEPFFIGKLSTALQDAGIKSGRTTRQGDFLSRFGFANNEMELAGTALSSYSAVTAKEKIDEIILRGTTLEFYIHNIIDDAEGYVDENTIQGGIHIYESTFTEIMDYIAEKKDAGELAVITKDELYNRDIDSTPASPTSAVLLDDGITSAKNNLQHTHLMMGNAKIFLNNNEAVYFDTPDKQAGTFETFIQSDQFIGSGVRFGDTGNYIQPSWLDDSGIVEVSTDPLTGETGTAGKVTIARNDDKVYIENRRGSFRTFVCNLSFIRNLA